jgi:hypothetical protein
MSNVTPLTPKPPFNAECRKAYATGRYIHEWAAIDQGARELDERARKAVEHLNRACDVIMFGGKL